MDDFYLKRGDELLGPMTAEELRTERVRPTDLVRYGDDGLWLHFSTLIATNEQARITLEDGAEPDEPEPEPWERRNLAEWTWPVMLLGADGLWLVTAAQASNTTAGWITAMIPVGIMVVAAVGMLRRRPWGWNLSMLLTGSIFAWLLPHLISTFSTGLIVWSSMNLFAALLLVIRRPRAAALDWEPSQRRLLLLYSTDPVVETRPLRAKAGPSVLATAAGGVVLFFVVVLGGVALYHRLRYPEYDFPLSIVPRGADIWARLARMGVYGLMVTVAVAMARTQGPALAALGITVGQGWRRAVWIGTLMFLVLFMVLLSGRWIMRSVEVVEERIALAMAPDDAVEPPDTAVGEVRSTIQGALDRSRRRPGWTWHGLWALLVAILIGPACEEIFFRGLLFGSLRRRWPFWAAALASSLVFAGAHGLAAGWGAATVVIWFEIVAGGLAAAYAYERTGTLFAPLVMHILWNGAQTATDMAPIV